MTPLAARAEASTAVRLENVSKHYRQSAETIRAVDEAGLRVEVGEFLIITGRSGSGKTTLLSLMGGLTNPTSGTVQVFGRSLDGMDDSTLSRLRADRLGFVFQFASLLPTLTTLDNVRLPGLFAESRASRDHAARLLSWVGLADKLHSYPAQLSGGQQARVAVARGLVNHPELLLADEPTGNLDVETEGEILELFREVNLRQGTAIVLVTHNPALACFGNRHLVMDRGQVNEVGSNLPLQVPAHE